MMSGKDGKLEPAHGNSRWPAVTVIVPTFRDPLLSECIAVVLKQDYGGEKEIIVVNNGTPGDLADLAAETPGVRFIDEVKPGSYHARNAGIDLAKGSIFAFTDSDCTPHTAWLSAGVACLMSDPEVGLVGGRIRLSPSQKRSLIEDYEVVATFPQREYVQRDKFAATANMFTHRHVLEKVGVFDGRLRSGGDADWGRRVAKAGYRLLYCEEARVDHPTRGSYAALVGKVKRRAAGARDRDPSWRGCLSMCARTLWPPIRQWNQVWNSYRKDLGIYRFLGVGLLIFIFRLRTGYERLLLQISGSESPRT